MGFLENFLNGDYAEEIGNRVVDAAKKIARNASDDKLRDWWDKNAYDPDIDDRAKEVIEREMRRRRL